MDNLTAEQKKVLLENLPIIGLYFTLCWMCLMRRGGSVAPRSTPSSPYGVQHSFRPSSSHGGSTPHPSTSRMAYGLPMNRSSGATSSPLPHADLSPSLASQSSDEPTICLRFLFDAGRGIFLLMNNIIPPPPMWHHLAMSEEQAVYEINGTITEMLPFLRYTLDPVIREGDGVRIVVLASHHSIRTLMDRIPNENVSFTMNDVTISMPNCPLPDCDERAIHLYGAMDNVLTFAMVHLNNSLPDSRRFVP